MNRCINFTNEVEKESISCYKKEKLRSFLNNNEYTDCTFVFGSDEIKAHKLILATCSPVFERMFFGQMAEDVVCLKDIKAGDFKKVLQFIYTENIEIASVTNAWDLYYIADKYLIDDLLKLCLSYVENNLTMSSLLLSYEYSEMFYLENLRKRCKMDINNYTRAIFISDYHMKPSTLLSILEEVERLNIPNSELVIRVLEWTIIECEKKEIEADTLNILQLLRDYGIFNHMRDLCKDISFIAPINKALFESIAYLEIYNILGGGPKITKHILPWALLCKLRQVYKISRRVDLLPNVKLSTTIKVNQKVILFAVVVNSERNPSNHFADHINCEFDGMIRVAICSGESSVNVVEPTKYLGKMAYDSLIYIPLKELCVLQSNQIYSIKVSYLNSKNNNGGRNILCHYQSAKLEYPHPNTRFLFGEVCGGVVRGVSYYPA